MTVWANGRNPTGMIRTAISKPTLMLNNCGMNGTIVPIIFMRYNRTPLWRAHG